MSSPATAAYLAACDRMDARHTTLALIELTVPSALTMRWATAETNVPGANTWQAGLTVDPITHEIDYLGPGVSPASASITLAARPDASQSSGTVKDLLHQYLFQNARVTLYDWIEGLTDFVDALQIFRGVISSPAEISVAGMTLNLLQDQTWNRQHPSVVVDKVSYPDSPDVSQGLPVPTVYGNHGAQPMRAPWPTAYGSKSKQEDAGAGLGVVPLVLVDAGVGAAAVKLVAAGHECADILDRANGYSTFVVGESLLNPMDTTGITETLGALESYLSIADENAIAFAPIIPIDVRTTGAANTATDPRKAMDVFDETTFATLNQTTGKNELQLILPGASALGRIESAQVYVAFTGNAGNTQNLRVNGYQPGVGFGAGAAVAAVSTGTTPQVMTGTWPTNYWTQAWDFGGGTTVFDVRVDFAGAVANNKASIHWVALVVKYRPQRSLVTPGRRTLIFNNRALLTGPYETSVPYVLKAAVRTLLPSYKLDGQFYANVKGYKDDGSGTFTGTPSALIERPADVIRHFLQTAGAIAPGDIETGVGAFGSFPDLRDTLRGAQPNDMKLACWIGERSTVQRVAQKMAEQSLVCVYQDRFTDKWLAFPWKPGALSDYRKTLSWFELGMLTAEETSVVDVRHAVRVKYAYDHFKSKTLYEAFINGAGSSQGFTQPTVRDQRLVVTTGVNDRIDWVTNAVTYSCQLAAGTYTPIGLAVEVRLKMRAAEADNSKDAGWGFSIRSGFNDKLDFLVGASTFQTILAEGDYAPEGLAIEAGRAMNSVFGTGRVFSWTYSHATNKFTVTANGTFQVDGSNTSPGIASSAMHVLGLQAISAVATSATMTFARYADRFWIAEAAVGHFVNLLWGTGAFATTSAATLLGWPKADLAAAVKDATAVYARGDRERLAATYEGYYGPKEENQIVADWVREEATAVEMRTRRFDLTGRPRVIARLSSVLIPDLRLGQVFELAADCDPFVAYPGYGSDGSWAGKPLRALSITHNCGPGKHVEVTAIATN